MFSSLAADDMIFGNEVGIAAIAAKTIERVYDSRENVFPIFAIAGFMMSGLDVPIHLKRWGEERVAGKTFKNIRKGFADAKSRREPT